MNSRLVYAVLFLLCAATAYAGLFPDHVESYDHIATLLDKSTVVCKGEVLQAPAPKYISNELLRGTGISVIRVDRCFKGSAPTQVQIATDEYLPAAGFGGGGTLLVPKPGEYGLFFLASQGPIFKPIDRTPFIRASRLMTADDVAGNPRSRLEADLLAGLNDLDAELQLQTIRSLGTLEVLSPGAIARLKGMLPAADALKRLYLWEALITVHDYSVLPQAADEVLDIAPRSREFSLPRDRIPFLQFRVYEAIGLIHDPGVVPYMRKLSEATDPRSRYDALQSLRGQHDQCSAQIFLKALGDQGQGGDTAFVAMHSLYELAETGPGWDVIPGPQDFLANGVAAAEVRSWWETVGETLAKSVSTNVCVPFQEGVVP